MGRQLPLNMDNWYSRSQYWTAVSHNVATSVLVVTNAKVHFRVCPFQKQKATWASAPSLSEHSYTIKRKQLSLQIAVHLWWMCPLCSSIFRDDTKAKHLSLLSHGVDKCSLSSSVVVDFGVLITPSLLLPSSFKMLWTRVFIDPLHAC